MRTKQQIEQTIKKSNLFFYFFAGTGSMAALLGIIMANTISLTVMFYGLAIIAFTTTTHNKLLLEMKRMSNEE
jgi:hypothetical protein